MNQQADFHINTLAIIGVGLIGGSLAIALRNAGVVDNIIGCGRQRANLEKAVELGVIDGFTQDVAKAVQAADVVFVAVPLGAMRSVFEQMKSTLPKNCVVTDGGSAKASVIEDWISVFGNDEQFVAGHPIAGTENSGVEAALPDLYQNRRIILTPTPSNHDEHVKQITRMWQICGSEVTLMPVEQHDQVLAATSHLPHVIAFSLVDTLAKLDQHTDIFKYAAGGFRDFTRIASSNPDMWRDICIANADAILPVMDQCIEEMQKMRNLISNQDASTIHQIFSDAKKARDDFVDGLEG